MESNLKNYSFPTCPNSSSTGVDLPNIKTDKNGKGSFELLDVFGRWSLDKEKLTSVLNKAIIVHAGMDDMVSQPSGAAGERIGCGVIKNTK